MLSKQDYRLMAGVFREVYLESETTVYMSGIRTYQEILWKFMEMLQRDNPRFRGDYFMNFIKHGTERPKKALNGVHHTEGFPLV